MGDQSIKRKPFGQMCAEVVDLFRPAGLIEDTSLAASHCYGERDFIP